MPQLTQLTKRFYFDDPGQTRSGSEVSPGFKQPSKTGSGSLTAKTGTGSLTSGESGADPEAVNLMCGGID